MSLARRVKALSGLMVSAATLLAFSAVGMSVAVPQAEAVTVDEYQQAVRNHADLKEQLAGVNSQLADLVIRLDDLTENQIPAAQEAANSANDAAEQAQSLADATAERLEAAQKDLADLQADIERTGADYDDAQAAVAQLARESFHGSAASDLMDVVTNATTTEEFVDRMQSEAAVTRSEANAAADAAGELGVSMTRQERLEAIEDEIAQLKTQADQQAAAAVQAAADAQAAADDLQALRDQGAQMREQLEAQSDQLTTQEAREAAQIVAMKSEIDSWAQNTGSSGNANPNAGGSQQIGDATSSGGASSGGSSSGGGTQAPPASSGGGSGGGTANGMDYAVPGGCAEGSSYCYGHPTGNSVGGSAYPARQCTLWAYIRRSQLSLPVGSYMGNGGDWDNTARSLGYLVNNTPHVGAAMVFERGQYVNGWYASSAYGHVAVVERVNADGSVLISEGGTGFATFPAYETVYNAGNYTYIHY